MIKNKDEKTTEKKKKKNKRGFFSTLLLIIFIGSLIACIYLLYKEINKEMGIHDMENNIQSFVKPSDDSNKNKKSKRKDTYTFDWEGLMKKSKYVVGWVQVPGIERINYPIVQCNDNQFFLTHDWTGAYQTAGAIFMNKYNTPDFTDMNTIVYGHRMKAGSMFGLLKYYESQEFMNKNPYFYIYTPEGRKLSYEIVYCSHVKDGSDAYMQHFNTPDDRMAYYDMMKRKAVAKRDVNLNRFDTTVMLSTCNSSAGYYERLVVLGKLTAIDLNGQPENWNKNKKTAL